ncbi:FNIP repeat-containing protein [Cotonvirus japonicus]|uniref:FNIP repeat-containing protein n=1 Tax=Cotonvirus japonicus TaxID=2811091 RepID=A0ABM7NRG7_9VIRU|nr:FNIP repeat-containing protein [Cotonvirus japonicus]BCS82749.1 FNIP repeat-containing protein [Cotonvirus japonicus]
MTTQKLNIRNIPQLIDKNSTHLEIELSCSDDLEIVDKIELDDLYLNDYPNLTHLTFHICAESWNLRISPYNFYPTRIIIDHCDRKLFIPKNISTIKFTGCPYTRIHGTTSQKIEHLIFDSDYNDNICKIFTNIEKLTVNDKSILVVKSNPIEIPDKWFDFNNGDNLHYDANIISVTNGYITIEQ